MTYYQKSKLREHFKRWTPAYSMATFMLVAILAIGIEAKREQNKLENYYELTQNFKDIA
jgi:hypothetical protein